ncbi:MAG: VWA domain-containing protein [Bacteroidales bacterium]|nr:VWA domain-containing protein [Bacteroidales bacterium]
METTEISAQNGAQTNDAQKDIAQNDGITELVIIIDKSGSMSGLESDTIGGFNSMLNQHKKGEGLCRLTTIFFSDNAKIIHDRVDISTVKPLTAADYIPGGCTALLDTVGNAISHTKAIQAGASADTRANKVVFVIITDGYENASREYSAPQIKQMITLLQDKEGWDFIFLGANIDAVETASSYGIRSNMSANITADSAGMESTYRFMHKAVSAARRSSKCAARSRSAAPAPSLCEDADFMSDLEELASRKG